MADQQIFTFKPALLRGAVAYEVTPDALVLPAGSHKTEAKFPWSEINRAVVVETTVRKGLRMRRIDLFHGAQEERLSINCTAFSSGSGTDHDVAEHLKLMAEIADQLATTHDGFEISFGEYGKSLWAMFIIGVVTLLAALGFVIAIIATGVSSDRLWDVAPPFLLMLLLGGGLVYGYRPWREVPKLDARVLAAILRNTAGVETT